MKTKVWDNPNKMHIESGHSEFDKQTVCISTGNVISPTQLSSHIRAYSNTKNLGNQHRPKGFLMLYDLKQFSICPSLYEWIKKHDESIILYKFFHWSRKGGTLIHGFIITDDDHNHVKTWVTGCSYKNELILKECAKYICN